MPQPKQHQVRVRIRLKPEILDPQGKAIARALELDGQTEIKTVRQNKEFLLSIEADSKQHALTIAQRAAETLLANPVMEDIAEISTEPTP